MGFRDCLERAVDSNFLAQALQTLYQPLSFFTFNVWCQKKGGGGIQSTGEISEPQKKIWPNGRKLSVGDEHTGVQIPVLQLTSYMYLFNISESQFSPQKNKIDLQSCSEKQILYWKCSVLRSCHYYDNDDWHQGCDPLFTTNDLDISIFPLLPMLSTLLPSSLHS